MALTSSQWVLHLLLVPKFPINKLTRPLIPPMASSGLLDLSPQKFLANGQSYMSRNSAQAAGLLFSYQNSPIYIGVDHNTVLNSAGAGRRSVRISSKRTFMHGLFISDIFHMPGGICGTWPARGSYAIWSERMLMVPRLDTRAKLAICR
jgi:hypothetical protein